ncbi:MAG TPA: hypothetical protein VNC61_06970 [Acidimicrobiales bacterium]|nr:hypothetical protein [Acidimicrobiales bacterium]
MSGVAPPATTDRSALPGPDPDQKKGPWYRHRAFLVPAAVVVVIGAAVLSDLPTPASRGSDIQGESTVIGEINTDVASCLFAVRESLTLYADESGRMSAAHRSQIPALLRDDLNACSFTNSGIFALSDINLLGSPAGRQVGQALNTVTVWATSDALGAIAAVQTLTSHPADRRAGSALHTDKRLLAEDRDRATSEIDAAGRLLKTNLPPLNLSHEVLPGVRNP